MSRVMGLDLSITATGVARADGTTFTVKSGARGDDRLVEIRNQIGIAAAGCHVAAVEDLVHSSQSAAISGMVHGAVRVGLMIWGVPYALVTPSALKKYATGNGAAPKPAMAVAAFKRAGREFADDNQCDAAWLRWMALDWLGEPEFEVPQAHRAALSKVSWPEVSL